MSGIDEVLRELRSLANPHNVAGMARYGISTKATLGVSLPMLRRIAARHRRDHALALALWDSGIHEARILAALVDDPKQVTVDQLERWVLGIDSWDICDGLCADLIVRTQFARSKAIEWSARPEEYVKRAGFVLIAQLAVHDKQAADEEFLAYLPVIAREAGDDRNFVRKAVNWALRQIGKRNVRLHAAAMAMATQLKAGGDRSARWVGSDALRDLQTPATRRRLRLDG